MTVSPITPSPLVTSCALPLFWEGSQEMSRSFLGNQKSYLSKNYAGTAKVFIHTLKKSLRSSGSQISVTSLVTLLKNSSLSSQQTMIDEIQKAYFKPKGYFSRLFSGESWDEWVENCTPFGRVYSAFLDTLKYPSSSTKLIRRLSLSTLQKAERKAKAILYSLSCSTEKKEKDTHSVSLSCGTQLVLGGIGSAITKNPVPFILGAANCLPKGLAAGKIGEEFPVNTVSGAIRPTISKLKNGNFVVAWQRDYDIYCQIFDPNGNKIGGGFRANTFINKLQGEPSIASLEDGNFAIVWLDSYQDGDGSGIYGQIFQSDGDRLGSEFRININVVGSQLDPSVAGLSNGNFAVVWVSYNEQNGPYANSRTYDIYSQLFYPNGSKIGSELHIASSDEGNLIRPLVTQLSDERFIVIWQTMQDTLKFYGQFFDLNGNKMNSQFLLLDQLSYPRSVEIGAFNIAALKNGNFVLVYQNNGFNGQLFTFNGSTIGNKFFVDDNDNSCVINELWHSNAPSIITLSDGNFIVTWHAYNEDLESGTYLRTYGQTFDPNGTKVKKKFIAGSTSSASAVLLDGNFVVVSTDYVHDVSISEIYGQIFSTNALPKIVQVEDSVPYTVTQPPTPIASKILLEDTDDTSLIFARIGITDNFIPEEDQLQFHDQSGIVGNYNTTLGTLTLTGVSSVTNYQTALRNITYINLSKSPDTTPRKLTIITNDGNDASNTITKNITINFLLSLTSVQNSANYTKYHPPVAINPTLTLTDPNDVFLISAQVAIVGNFVPGEDQLDFDNQNGIIGSFNPITGILSLTGIASVAHYEKALRSVTYKNASNHPITSPRTIKFTVSDGKATNSPLMVNVNLLDSNDPPFIQDPIPLQRAQIWRQFQYALPSTTFRDLDDDPITYSADKLPSWLHFDQSSLLFSGMPSLIPWEGEAVSIRVTARDALHATSTSFRLEVGISEMLQDLFLYYAALGVGIAGLYSLTKLFHQFKYTQQKDRIDRLYLDYTKWRLETSTASVSERTVPELQENFATFERHINQKNIHAIEKISHNILSSLRQCLETDSKIRVFDLLTAWPLIRKIANRLKNGVILQLEERALVTQCKILQELLDLHVLYDTRQNLPVSQKEKADLGNVLGEAIDCLKLKSKDQVHLRFLLEQCREALFILLDDITVSKWKRVKQWGKEATIALTVPPWGMLMILRLCRQMPQSWYTDLLYIKQLVPLASKSEEVLQEIQMKMATSQDWRFLFGSVCVLGRVARMTTSQTICKSALQKSDKVNQRGLQYYADKKEFLGQKNKEQWICQQAQSEISQCQLENNVGEIKEDIEEVL